MKKKPQKKEFVVNVDMKWSLDIFVTATTKTEARNKAWAVFKSRKCSRRLFELLEYER